jgi:hypothetical protein
MPTGPQVLTGLNMLTNELRAIKTGALITTALLASLCSGCSHTAGDSNATKVAAPANGGIFTTKTPPSPYVCRVRDLMSSSHRKRFYSRADGRELDLRTEFVGTLCCSPDYREKRLKELSQQMHDIEQVSGLDSLPLVPLLIRQALVHSDASESSRCIQRALRIAENASARHPPAKEALNAAQALEETLSLPSLRNLPSEQTRLLKCVFLLKLEAQGLDSNSCRTLTNLTSSLNKDSLAVESCQLLELATSHFDEKFANTDESLKQSYKEALLCAGRKSEADVVEQELASLRKQRNAETEKHMDAAVEAARKRAEIDPYSLAEAELQYASFESGTGNKQSTLIHFGNASRIYRELQTSGDYGQIDRSMTNVLREILRARDLELDEKTLYSFVDDAEERAARAHQTRSYVEYAFDDCRPFAGNRYYDLLRHMLDKRRQLRPHDSQATGKLSAELARHDVDSGSPGELANQRKSLFEEAETRFGKADPQLLAPLVELGDKYHKQGQDELALQHMDRAAALLDRLKPTGYPFPYIQHMVYFYARVNELEKADKALRIGYKLLRRTDDQSASGGACLDDALRSLVERYQNAEEYVKAESLIALAQQNRDKLTNDGLWIDRLNKIYLAHAAQLKRQGKLSQAKKILALSNAEFEKQLKRTENSCKKLGTKYSDKGYRKLRQNVLKERGL